MRHKSLSFSESLLLLIRFQWRADQTVKGCFGDAVMGPSLHRNGGEKIGGIPPGDLHREHAAEADATEHERPRL